MKNILVATDFSENSDKALEYAIFLAKAYESKIYLIHTYLPYYIEPGIYSEMLILEEPLNEQYQITMAKFDPLVKKIREAGLKFETILELNDVTSGIFDAIEKYSIDLLVIGRTGSGGFLNKLVGSNAAHIIAKASIPVLAIPQQVEKISIQKVLYATQLEYDENDVLEQVFAITKKLGAYVNLVKVNAAFEPDIQSDKQFKDQIYGAFANEDFQLDTVDAESVTEGILRTAREQKADLIVLAARHRNFLSQIIDPSKSKQVIISSPLPVLTFQLKGDL
jgi:nucleotide-binding universal stress UspA family protein